MTTQVQQMRVGTRLFPADSIPSGWYQIGWSQEFGPGSVTPLHYFERALVAFRGESGELHVLDAYCPHMGAHLGHGGKVVEDEIMCPYHGWRWSGSDGANTVIPYGDKPCLNISIGAWPTREVDGIALVYYSPNRSEALYDPPERFCRTTGDIWQPHPEATELWRDVALVPQWPAENVPDAAHFTYIHRAPKEPHLRHFEINGGCFRVQWDITFGDGRQRTWATPTGPVDGHIFTETWGLGLGWNVQHAFDEITSLSGYTPIDRQTADVRLTVWASKERRDGSELDVDLRDRWFRFQKGQLESDMVVWSNQTYIDRPPFAATEMSAMRALREWSKQFYEPQGDDAPVVPLGRRAVAG